MNYHLHYYRQLFCDYDADVPIWRLVLIILHYVYDYHTFQSLQIISVQINQTVLVPNYNTLFGTGQKSSDIFLCTQMIATRHRNSIATWDQDMFLENDIDKKVQFCRNAESTCLVPAKFASFGTVCVRYCQFPAVQLYSGKTTLALCKSIDLDAKPIYIRLSE